MEGMKEERKEGEREGGEGGGEEMSWTNPCIESLSSHGMSLIHDQCRGLCGLLMLPGRGSVPSPVQLLI